MDFDVDAVLFGEAQHQISGHPHLVGGGAGTLAEDLEFPLALRDSGVDAFVVDAGGEAQIEMLFHHLAGDISDVLVACSRHRCSTGPAAPDTGWPGNRAGGRPYRRNIPEIGRAS